MNNVEILSPPSTGVPSGSCIPVISFIKKYMNLKNNDGNQKTIDFFDLK